MTSNMTRRLLFRWAGWFALANAVVFGVVSLRYFSGGVPVEGMLSAVYLVAVYIGHHVVLATAPLFLLATPVILIIPNRRVVTVLAVLLFAIMVALMMLDSLLWSQSRFHINALTMKILGWQSWVFAGVIFVVGLFFESFLARSVWNWVLASPKRSGRLIGAVSALMIVLSQGIHAWADAAYYVPVTSLGQQLPVYRGVTAKSFMTKSGLVDVKEARERGLARQMSKEMDAADGRLLNYPLNPLDCEQREPLNLVMIIADSMRGSVLTPEMTPNISRFAQQDGIEFRNHFSGGNSSRMGMFSLLYGLPVGYWNSFVALARPPVLIDEFEEQGYQLGLFSSATMYRPVQLDRTAFARVPNLRIVTDPESDPSWKRDWKMTREWFEWLDSREQEKPFFGFVFYDSTTTKSFPPDYAVQFPPMKGEFQAEDFSRYQRAVHYVDSLVGEVLSDLRERGLLNSTVVLITSDHGEEFGESDAKLKKHGSGYTRHQLMTPLVISWPGRNKGAFYEHRTSHYDIVPTLMQDLFGCSNPPEDYSVGRNLFDLQNWDWILAGSYYNYALIEPDQITITFPSGLFEVRDWDYKLLDDPVFRGDVLEAVSEQNARYFVE